MSEKFLEQPPQGRELAQLHLALLDTDALQLTCTIRELNAVRCSCVHFNSANALIKVIRQGTQFDGVVIALHGDGNWSISQLMEIRGAAPDEVVNVVLIAHDNELIKEKWLVSNALRAGMDFVRSPIDSTEFLLRFDHLGSTS